MGPFAKDYFSNFGKSTDFTRQLTRDYFFTVNHHWLDVYHVDGFRYDCVPNYWDGPLGVGYASLVYETYQLAKTKIAQGDACVAPVRRGTGSAARAGADGRAARGSRRACCARATRTAPGRTARFDAARAVARGDRGRLFDLGLYLGLFGYPDVETTNGDVIPKTALQYIENHDHERFMCNFGIYNPDEAGNPLFQEGDRGRWYMLQPYLIALLMSKGIPMLWQGEEFAENYFLPDFGAGRVALLRPLRWDYFYDGSGQPIVALVRKLLRIRRAARPHPARHVSSSSTTGIAINRAGCCCSPATTARATRWSRSTPATPTRRCRSGFRSPATTSRSSTAAASTSSNIAALQEVALTIPSHYGRIWTAAP